MQIGMGIGEIALGQAEGMQLGLPALTAEARRAEQEGFASVWLANINAFDALTVLTVIGLNTERIALGTAVVPTFPRHPFAMAQQAMSVQAATGNRLSLGIGLSHKIVIENMLGLSWAKPYSHMREYLAVLTALIRKGKVEHRGAEYSVSTMLRATGAQPCPVLIAALAPKMLALAGQVADGTVTWMAGPKTIRDHVAPAIRGAAVTSSSTAIGSDTTMRGLRRPSATPCTAPCRPTAPCSTAKARPGRATWPSPVTKPRCWRSSKRSRPRARPSSSRRRSRSAAIDRRRSTAHARP